MCNSIVAQIKNTGIYSTLGVTLEWDIGVTNLLELIVSLLLCV